uniref:Retrotransposon gag domain-containing protein n=1 Tax=Photinus pyralis TaxID=7054 RepID=A0A1Y1LV18_PHOPY
MLVDELRARLTQYLRSPSNPIDGSQPEVMVPEAISSKVHGGTRASEDYPNIRPATTATLTRTEICDKVRKWGVRFDGTGDPLAFLERIDELRECYGFRDSDLLHTLPEMLKGKALLWYRNHKDFWRTNINWRKKYETESSVQKRRQQNT